MHIVLLTLPFRLVYCHCGHCTNLPAVVASTTRSHHAPNNYDRIIESGIGDGRPWQAVRLLFEPFLDSRDADHITSRCISAIKQRHPRMNVTALNDIGMRVDELEPLGTYEHPRELKKRAALVRDVGTLLAAANVAASRSSFPLMLLKMSPALRQLHIPTAKDATPENRKFMLQ